MEKHYLEIDYKTSSFYEYNGEPKEGFEEYVSNTGKKSYRKTYDKGVFGTLESISMVEDKQGRSKLVMRMLDGEDINLAALNIYDQKGQIDYKLVEPLIGILPNLQLKEAYRLYPYAMDKEYNGNTKTYYGISIKSLDLSNKEDTKSMVSVSPKYTRRKKDEEPNDTHLPDLVFEKELGKFKPTAVSVDTKKKFLIKVLEEELDRLGWKPDSNTPTTPAQPPRPTANTESKQKVQTPTPQEQEDFDDLPF